MAARTLVVAQETFSVDVLVRRAAAVLLTVDLAVLLRFAVADWPRPWLHILGEARTVSWLSSMQLALVGWLAIAIALIMGVHRAARYRRWQRAAWVGFGLAGLVGAADKSLHWHQTVVVPQALQGAMLGGGVLLGLAGLGGLLTLLLMLPQLLAVPRALRLFAVAVVLAGLSQAEHVIDLAAVFALSPAWQRGARMVEASLELMAEVGFILSLVALLATYVSRMASSGTASAAIARYRLSQR